MSNAAEEQSIHEFEKLVVATSKSAVRCSVRLNVIQVTGKDRARFLHNFCTQQINELQPGHCAEATFTDVKARVVDHGYVLAGNDSHAIVTFGQDAEKLHLHLDRYIITEDVQLDPHFGQPATVLAGPETWTILNGLVEGEAGPDQCDASAAAWFTSTWHNTAIAWLITPALAETAQQLSCLQGTEDIFQFLRISEGFPVVGIDVNSDNIAPEANRVKRSISYTKGCYLGQEPIARLDAMGHVNRQLYRGHIVGASEDPAVAVITSQSKPAGDQINVLLLAKVKDAASGTVAASLPDGKTVSVQLQT